MFDIQNIHPACDVVNEEFFIFGSDGTGGGSDYFINGKLDANSAVYQIHVNNYSGVSLEVGEYGADIVSLKLSDLLDKAIFFQYRG